MCSNCQQNREHVEFVAEQMNTSERVRENYREQGRCQERERIIKLLENQPFIWMGEKQMIQISRNN